jgi:hypothetical protein
MLTPHHTDPAKAILDRAQAWLDRQSVDHPQPKSPAGKPNGRADPHKLDAQQREALGMLLSLGNSTLRRAGVTTELAQRAADGQAVPREAIAKLVAFLAC